MIVFNTFRFAYFPAIFIMLATACATSISGGDETEETSPTPTPGLIRSEDTPETTPTESPSSKPIPARIDSSPSETPTPPPSDDYKTAFISARNAFRDKNYDEALEQVRKAESLKPDLPELINFRGAIYAETGRYVEAVKLYEKSLAIQPDSFWPAFNIAEVDFIQKKYSDARTKLEALMVKFPNHELLRFKIILTYLLEKNDPSAKAEMDKFTFPANTAAREFAMAAWEFAHDNDKGGNGWVNSGIYIFGYGRTDFLYQSLADLKWVPLPRPTPVMPK